MCVEEIICIHNIYMYTPLRSNMAKLYWRIKKNGKWTWQPAEVITPAERGDLHGWYEVEPVDKEEEE